MMVARTALPRKTGTYPAICTASAGRSATCPCCGRAAHFTHSGDQRWSEAVAQAAGLPRIMPLYTCAQCGTTVSEQALLAG
jgi:hypothetical protein